MILQGRFEPLLGHLSRRHSLQLAVMHARCVVLELAIDAAPEAYLIVRYVHSVRRGMKLLNLVW